MKRWLRYQPRSILRLILVSYVVVLIPPILAIFVAIGSLEVLFAQGRTAVFDSVRAAQNGRVLMEQVTVMERNALQFLAVGDPVFMQSYLRTREALLASVDALSPLTTRSPEFAARLAAFQGHEIDVAKRLRSPDASADDIAAIAHEFDVLREDAQGVLDQSRVVINQEVLSIQRRSERARWAIIGIAAIQLPLAILAAIVFTLLIGHRCANCAGRSKGWAMACSRVRSACAARATSPWWGNGSTGCGSGSSIWRSRRPSFCVRCPTS